MTKLKIKIMNQKSASLKMKDGVYLAKFFEEDDRILIYNAGCLTGVIECKGYLNNFNLQLKQTSENYSELKKIKQMTLEVELE